jgi:hypothetical protein
MEKLNVICPCCEATLSIDQATGAILAHAEKNQSSRFVRGFARRDGKTKKSARTAFFAGNVFAERPLAHSRRKVEEAQKRAGGDIDKPFKIRWTSINILYKRLNPVDKISHYCQNAATQTASASETAAGAELA